MSQYCTWCKCLVTNEKCAVKWSKFHLTYEPLTGYVDTASRKSLQKYKIWNHKELKYHNNETFVLNTWFRSYFMPERLNVLNWANLAICIHWEPMISNSLSLVNTRYAIIYWLLDDRTATNVLPFQYSSYLACISLKSLAWNLKIFSRSPANINSNTK